jgi:hypothetical protein
MPEDPRDPETLDDYLDDDLDYDGQDDDSLGDGAPEADVAEQRLELLRLRDTPLTPRTLDAANAADAAEQSRVVDPGDEEYR